jgi:hypothetical protein
VEAVEVEAMGAEAIVIAITSTANGAGKIVLVNSGILKARK